MPQAALKGCATIVLKRLVTIAHRGRPAIAPRGCAAIVLAASTVLVFASTALLIASAPVVVGSTADVAASGLVAAQAFRPPVRSTAFVGRAFAPTDQDGSSRPSFSEWLAGLRAEAITRGIKPDVVDAALAGVSEPVQLILERDRSQAETVFSLESYIRKRLTPKLIAAGRDAFARERELVDRVGEKYGVPPRLIAAIWGIESYYGHFSGVRPTVPALATLAWDPRRATFFRGELFDALEILNRGDIDLEHMRGSWAGAMGQVQFMPSSYLKYAEDYDGDGRRDIWSSSGDVFASIANYLKGHGWQGESTWGREVKMSPEVARRIRADVAPRTGDCQ